MLVANAISPPISVHTLLTGWHTDWLSLLASSVDALAIGWYVNATRRIRAKGRRWALRHTISFVAGMLAIVLAVGSGLASYDDSVFSMHIVQHLLLMNVAPILLALGAPMTLALQSSGRATQQRILSVLRCRVVAVITNPFVVLAAYAGTMLVYFLTPLYQVSLEHPLLHDYTHLQFLVTGSLYWWLIVGLDPSLRRLTYPMKLGLLAVGIPVASILGLGLTQARTSIAPAFHSLGDTHAGGSILWVACEVTTFTALIILMYQWMRADSREANRSDRRTESMLLNRSAALATGDANAREHQANAVAIDEETGLRRVVVMDGRLVGISDINDNDDPHDEGGDDGNGGTADGRPDLRRTEKTR